MRCVYKNASHPRSPKGLPNAKMYKYDTLQWQNNPYKESLEVVSRNWIKYPLFLFWSVDERKSGHWAKEKWRWRIKKEDFFSLHLRKEGGILASLHYKKRPKEKTKSGREKCNVWRNGELAKSVAAHSFFFFRQNKSAKHYIYVYYKNTLASQSPNNPRFPI